MLPEVTIIVGPTGAGKTTLLKQMVSKGVRPIISYTTRVPRKNEIDHIDYHFISEEKWMELYNNDSFICSRKTLSKESRLARFLNYGVLVDDFNDDFHSRVIILDPKGSEELASFLDEKRMSYQIIYLDAPLSIRIDRCLLRGDPLNQIMERIASETYMLREFDLIGKWDFKVGNH